MPVALVRYNPNKVSLAALQVLRERLTWMVPATLSVEGGTLTTADLQIWMLPCDRESAMTMMQSHMGLDYNPGEFDFQIVLITKYYPDRQGTLDWANARMADGINKALKNSRLDLKGFIYTLCVPAAFNVIG